jgi:hypothetical protein
MMVPALKKAVDETQYATAYSIVMWRLTRQFADHHVHCHDTPKRSATTRIVLLKP